MARDCSRSSARSGVGKYGPSRNSKKHCFGFPKRNHTRATSPSRGSRSLSANRKSKSREMLPGNADDLHPCSIVPSVLLTALVCSESLRPVPMKILRCLYALTWIVSSQLFAADWPCWRGQDGLGVSTEKNLPTEWSKEKNIAWKIGIPGKGASSPIIVGDRAYVSTQTSET